MGESNQILDVTYGSFSCRLEGFDDSVETMKMVVSFFHELEGRDLFMGTAPQAPDMATLARLTEEQTGVAVEVENDGNAVSLRVRKDDPEEQHASGDSLDDDETRDLPSEDGEPDEGSYFDDVSSVAGKLQRMRDAATSKKAAHSEEFAEDLSEPVAEAPATTPLSQRLSDLAKQTAATEVSMSEPSPEMQEAGTPAQVAAPDLTASEEIAEDQNDDKINVFSDLDEIDVTSGDVEDTRTDAFEEESARSDQQEPEPDALAGDTYSDGAEVTDFVESDDEFDEAQTAVMNVPEAPTDEVAAMIEDEDEAFSTATDPAEGEADAEDADEALASDTAEDTLAEEAESESEAPPLVLTSDDEAEHDDYNDDDEFDLEKEVAKVEAEIAARRGNEFARRGLPRHVEDAMSRIMSQTDQHLNQPENRRHRDAFAQLKAAVAATEAARQLGDKGADKRDPDEAYKDDLGAHDAKEKGDGDAAPPLKLVKSQEVRPGKGTADPATGTDAQANEAAAAPQATSERLRRIAGLKETDAPAPAGGFAEFAASHGATDLVDQMEAAGAYICFVQGEDDFSRPQVMKLVQSASNREISREDGLRNFGRLLRLARLVKLPNGRFQIADNSQYRPDGHKAAQG